MVKWEIIVQRKRVGGEREERVKKRKGEVNREKDAECVREKNKVDIHIPKRWDLHVCLHIFSPISNLSFLHFFP